MTLQEQLRALVERHLANLGAELATVSTLLTPNGDSLPVPQAVEAEGIMHQLKGTAGSMGFADIGTAAAALDAELKILKKRSEPIPTAELQPALQMLGTLRDIAEHTTPAMSALYNADLSKLTH